MSDYARVNGQMCPQPLHRFIILSVLALQQNNRVEEIPGFKLLYVTSGIIKCMSHLILITHNKIFGDHLSSFQVIDRED